MMGVFKKIWPDVWSPRMEYILNNTILALLDYPGSTMLGVNRMMSDKDYRKRVYPKIKDPVVKSFWLNEFDQWDDKFRKEAVAAIQNKVGQFLSSFVIRHIVGQPKSTIDMREIMDNKKILIVNLSKGKIGEDAMHLLGGMIVTKIQLAAMGRVEIPEEDRKDFYLYVDEFQNFATESFANILSEARKYRLCLILAHQYINQLIFDGNATVRDAIFGNVGTIVSFRVGAEDAEHLEKEFEPVFMQNDIVNLSKYQMYLKLMIDGIAGDAFSATSLPPVDLSDTADNEEKAIKISRERYGKSRAEVEEKIARWSGMFDFEEFEREAVGSKTNGTARKNSPTSNVVAPVIRTVPRPVANSPVEKPVSVAPARPRPVAAPPVEATPLKSNSPYNNPMKESNPSKVNADPVNQTDSSGMEKPIYEAVCDTCEEKIQVPFKPDPSRPTFCKECLKDYQRARARTKAEKEEAQNTKHEARIMKQDTNSVPRDTRSTEPVVFMPQDKPISLGQMKHIAPKKFKPGKKNIKVDLAGIKKIIDQTRENKSNE